MKTWFWRLLPLFVLGFFVTVTAPSAQTLNGTLVQTSASVNSSTVPVQILAPGTYAGWTCNVKSTAAVVIDCFFFTGTVPGSAPSNLGFFLSPGGSESNSQISISKFLPNYGIGCVLDTGSTAVATACTAQTP